MGVPEKILHLQQEKVKPRRRPDARHSLPAEIRELSEQAEGEVNTAEQFLEETGIRLALFEFNQDLLGNRGRVTTDSSFRYTEKAEGTNLIYHSNLILKWGNIGQPYYSLVVGIEGDLLDTFEDEYGQEDYVKRLTMTLFQSSSPENRGQQVGPRIDFGRNFDIYDPLSLSDSSIMDEFESEEDADKYIEMEEKEGTEDLGGNTFKNWVEVNIAGFISYMQREMHQDPLAASST